MNSRAARVPVRVVCATQLDRAQFFAQSLLGRSLMALRALEPVELALFPSNRVGLPTLYNRAIEAAARQPALLVFVHDDVLISDFYWAAAVRDGLGAFDVIGLAGGRTRTPDQDTWFTAKDRQPSPDGDTGLSGVVGHGDGFPPRKLSVFGPAAVPVLLLDGLFLAAASDTLLRRGVRFDERFRFHFYDLDFCRSAEARGLSLGTWPISAVHASGGNFRSAAWEEARVRYLEKWGG